MKHALRSCWIIGAGKFGVKAVKRLRKKHPEAHITVVDRDQNALNAVERFSVKIMCHEGAAYLDQNWDGKDLPDWIIPAVPIHLAFEWLRLRMTRESLFQEIPVPVEIEAMVPNPIRGREGQLFASYADCICPDNCTEPFDRCTFTGKPRKGLLYQTLERIIFEDFVSVVVRSRQLAPGVGGYTPAALNEALHKVASHQGHVLFSTACLCHGVMHAATVYQNKSRS